MKRGAGCYTVILSLTGRSFPPLKLEMHTNKIHKVFTILSPAPCFEMSFETGSTVVMYFERIMLKLHTMHCTMHNAQCTTAQLHMLHCHTVYDLHPEKHDGRVSPQTEEGEEKNLSSWVKKKTQHTFGRKKL